MDNIGDKLAQGTESHVLLELFSRDGVFVGYSAYLTKEMRDDPSALKAIRQGIRSLNGMIKDAQKEKDNG